MNDSSNFVMIGLHKLAAERGDGLIPELLALYKQRDAAAERATLPVSAPHIMEHETSMARAGNDNVIPFLPYLLARKGR
jgi:hypothetical protein